jgi:hypothetical protein
MKIESHKLLETVKLLCYDNYRKNGTFLLPRLNTKNREPFLSESLLDKALEEYLYEKYNNMLLPVYYNEVMIKEVLREVLFDGKGFFIPCFAMYVNARVERQIPNDIQIVNNKPMPYYNFDKDEHFKAFSSELLENINRVEEWIKEKQRIFSNRVQEYTHMLNEDGTGDKMAQAPYLKQIEERLKGQ